MKPIKSHTDLQVYQSSMSLVIDIYELTQLFPFDEKFGLTSQLKRAVISIPSNIAEGAARQSRKEFVRFLYMSLGSAAEVETQLEIAKRLSFIKEENGIVKDIIYIKRMLIKLIESLKDKND